MRSFNVLVFQGHRLVASEQLEAPDVVEAVEACSGRDRSNLIELWTEGKLAARLPPAIGRHEDGL